MRFAIDVAPLGELADPVAIVRLGQAAEASGWDGLSIWDSFGVSMGTVAPDLFVALGAVAGGTERIRLIASVVVLPRRRPQLVAQSIGTLDRLSGGRVIVGVGAGGDPADFDSFGEGAPLAERVRQMDADLAVLDPWLRGDEARMDAGDAVAVRVGPRSVQQPRPPIWLGGMRPGALRRAAQWDGWIAIAVSDDGSELVLSSGDLRGMVERVDAERAVLGRSGIAFDVAVFGFSDPASTDVVRAYAEAGATWWLESLSPMRGSVEALLRIVEAGPPSIG